MRAYSRTINDFVYKRYRQNARSTAAFSVTGTQDGDSSLTILIDENGGFLTQFVRKGDSITNVTSGASGTVVSVDSNSQLTTSALVGGTRNNWLPSDNYSISGASSVTRIGIPTPCFICGISGNSGASNGLLAVYIGNNTTTPKWGVNPTANQLFSLDPDIAPVQPEEADYVIVQMSISGGYNNLNLSYEN